MAHISYFFFVLNLVLIFFFLVDCLRQIGIRGWYKESHRAPLLFVDIVLSLCCYHHHHHHHRLFLVTSLMLIAIVFYKCSCFFYSFHHHHHHQHHWFMNERGKSSYLCYQCGQISRPTHIHFYFIIFLKMQNKKNWKRYCWSTTTMTNVIDRYKLEAKKYIKIKPYFVRFVVFGKEIFCFFSVLYLDIQAIISSKQKQK